MSLTCDSVWNYYYAWKDQLFNNKWIRFPKFHCTAYLRIPRKGRYLSEDEPNVPCIDLAALEVDEPQRHKGHGSAFLEHMEDLATKKGIVVYVEAINVPWIREAFQKRGYLTLKSDKRAMYKDFFVQEEEEGKVIVCDECVDLAPECGGALECPKCGKPLVVCCPGRACAKEGPPRKKIRVN